MADAADWFRDIVVLVNNAGVSGRTKAVHELDSDDWEAVIKVDLTGTFNVTKHAIAHLIGSCSGVIITMSSATRRFDYPNRSPYATARWGIIGFTKTLSMELGEHNIRANAIAPGAVDGARNQGVFQGRAEANGSSLDDVKTVAIANQSIKHL